ncbi:hypothetical protein THAOC_00405 [Thalassiosira oceanica]|uniref:DUF7495 domain-containing protein n=1 Tax=Thalassiosira oceanica TaxID=159749 RepID=K3W4D4_THAOC|nr:hypothetical protein THAOC_00405 [Thalassiosira oceanica]|eukprot:EJK77744.1 hypothetical protein THAOC_00405 [Thalassiosira oceanica]
MDDEIETNHQRRTPADEAVPASCDGASDPPQPLALLTGGDSGPRVPTPIQQQEQLALGDEEVEVYESALCFAEEDSDRAPIPLQQQEQQLDDAKRKAKAEISTAIGARGRDERDSTTELVDKEREEDLRPISARSRVGASLGELDEEEAPSMSAPRQRSGPSLCLADCDNDPPVPIQQQVQLLALDDKAVKNKKKQEAKDEEQKSVMTFVDEEGSDPAPIPVQQQMQQFDDTSEISTANSASGIYEKDLTTELTAEEMEVGEVNLRPSVGSRVGASLGELEACVEVSLMATPPKNDAADARLSPDEIPIYDGIAVHTVWTRLQTGIEYFWIEGGISQVNRQCRRIAVGKEWGGATNIPVPNEPTGQAALVPALSPAEPTPLPSPRPQSDAPTDVPTPTHEQRPRWFQTLHPDFQEMSLFHDENDLSTSQLAEAAEFCYRQDMFMCTYDVICPNGKGNPPFKGGPPYATNTDSLNETQWVPYYRSNLDQKEGKQWAQIGKIPDGKGGSDENSYGLCWDYDEWSNYDAVDIEDIWGEETRVWMLCCSDPDENSNDAVGSGFKPTLQPTNNATSNRHKCACEAEEMDFKIDCDDRQAMTDALDFINTNGCTEKGSCEAGTECEKNYLTVQSHYNLCPEENIPEAIEDGIHDFDESCLGCDILRAYTVGAPDCPAAVCTDTSGEDAYVSLIEKNCASDCSTDECKGLFLTLRVVHESCPNGVLTDAAERGLQDLEGLCKDVICNAGGKDDDPFTCTEVDKAGYDDRDDYRVTFSPAPSPSTYEPTLTAFPTTDPPVETVPDRG